MTHRDLVRLFAYNDWANHLLLGACEPLSREEMIRDFHSGHHSIFGTLVHLFGAERMWLERWRGIGISPRPSVDAYPTISELSGDWREIEINRAQWFSDQDEAHMTMPMSYETLHGDHYTQPFEELGMHVVNHGTHHRGQVAAFLRALGNQPPMTDLVHYFRSVE